MVRIENVFEMTKIDRVVLLLAAAADYVLWVIVHMAPLRRGSSWAHAPGIRREVVD